MDFPFYVKNCFCFTLINFPSGLLVEKSTSLCCTFINSIYYGYLNTIQNNPLKFQVIFFSLIFYPLLRHPNRWLNIFSTSKSSGGEKDVSYPNISFLFKIKLSCISISSLLPVTLPHFSYKTKPHI